MVIFLFKLKITLNILNLVTWINLFILRRSLAIPLRVYIDLSSSPPILSLALTAVCLLHPLQVCFAFILFYVFLLSYWTLFLISCLFKFYIKFYALNLRKLSVRMYNFFPIPCEISSKLPGYLELMYKMLIMVFFFSVMAFVIVEIVSVKCKNWYQIS